jgi:hypothetical protein
MVCSDSVNFEIFKEASTDLEIIYFQNDDKNCKCGRKGTTLIMVTTLITRTTLIPTQIEALIR